jgi:hypothetical protein
MRRDPGVVGDDVLHRGAAAAVLHAAHVRGADPRGEERVLEHKVRPLTGANFRSRQRGGVRRRSLTVRLDHEIDYT